MKKFFAVLMILLLVTAGCGKEPASQSNDSQTQKNSQNTEFAGQNENSEEGKDKKRNDQGDTNILIEGDIVYKDHKLTVEGETNLLPGSLLKLNVDSISGFLIGTHDTVRVDEDGSFQLDTSLPTDYGHPYVYVEIAFEPAPYAKKEVIQQYKEDGELLEGPFVRLFEENESLNKKVSINTLVPIDEKVTIPIEPPAREIPDDYGSPEVWLEADVKEDEKFVYVYGKSNLLEGSSVTGFLNVEGYITTGFTDSVHVNPDGTFLLIITHPSTLIKEHKEFTVNLEFNPKNEQSFTYVLDTYGEKGEKLMGNLVQKDDDSAKLVYTKKIGD